MQRITNREAKEIMLDMLQDITSYCDNEGIEYRLMSGTLLGAVRHRGFIPWDDDTDIAMNRKDYERFFSSEGYSSEKYSKVSVANDSSYYLPFGKVFDNRTLLIEDVSVDYPLGVYIDVFPLDHVKPPRKSSSSTVKRALLIKAAHTVRLLKPRDGRSFAKKLVISLGSIVLSRFSAADLAAKLNSFAMKSDARYAHSGWVSCLVDPAYGNCLAKEEDWSSSVEMRFEGLNLKAPAGWGSILKSTYGDYMTPPPPDQQVTHHVSMAFWR